jgi:hypothetical protein
MVVVPVMSPVLSLRPSIGASLLALAFQYMTNCLAGRDHFVEPRERSFAVVLRQGSMLDKVADQCLDLVIREVAAGHAVPRFDGVFTRSICCSNWAYFPVEQGGESRWSCFVLLGSYGDLCECSRILEPFIGIDRTSPRVRATCR